MIHIKKTDSSDPDFIQLVKLLDNDLAERDGTEHHFYAQYNKINMIKHAIVIYENDQPAGCGAIKEFSKTTMEVKRMYTVPQLRGKGIAKMVLIELEKWASELGYERCVMETGKRQPEAIRLYEKSGYERTPNYGQYIGIENSLCFEKKL